MKLFKLNNSKNIDKIFSKEKNTILKNSIVLKNPFKTEISLGKNAKQFKKREIMGLYI